MRRESVFSLIGPNVSFYWPFSEEANASSIAEKVRSEAFQLIAISLVV